MAFTITARFWTSPTLFPQSNWLTCVTGFTRQGYVALDFAWRICHTMTAVRLSPRRNKIEGSGTVFIATLSIAILEKMLYGVESTTRPKLLADIPTLVGSVKRNPMNWGCVILKLVPAIPNPAITKSHVGPQIGV